MFVEEVLRGLEQEPAHDPGGAKDHYRYMELLPGTRPCGIGGSWSTADVSAGGAAGGRVVWKIWSVLM